MTLQQVRDLFIEVTGFVNLVTPTGENKGGAVANKGANFFINSGRRWLDNNLPHTKSKRWYNKNMAVGDYLFYPRYLKAVDNIFIVESDCETELEEREEDWLRKTYNINQTDSNGTPCYWSYVTDRLSPEQSNLTAANYTNEFTYGGDIINFADDFTYSGIMIMPITNAVYTLKIKGEFYSEELSANSDTNFWTINYPEVLALAAALRRELFYRNFNGVAEYKTQIFDEMSKVDLDRSYRNSINITKFKG